jgi:hypothetical protein
MLPLLLVRTFTSKISSYDFKRNSRGSDHLRPQQQHRLDRRRVSPNLSRHYRHYVRWALHFPPTFPPGEGAAEGRRQDRVPQDWLDSNSYGVVENRLLARRQSHLHVSPLAVDFRPRFFSCAPCSSLHGFMGRISAPCRLST